MGIVMPDLEVKRPSGRAYHELREVKIERNFLAHAEGSVLIAYGNTKVICTASVLPTVPRFLRNKNQGWLTAEYGMLPRSTHDRMNREAAHGKQSGRTQEIQRLIGRALRMTVDLKALGERTLAIDCDVIQADGGTRTASITGACIAVWDACQFLLDKKKVKTNPFKLWIAGVSVGIYQGTPILDLDYQEDSNAETDLNLIMTESGKIIEIQGTAEAAPFDFEQSQAMLTLGAQGISELIEKQQQVL